MYQLSPFTAENVRRLRYRECLHHKETKHTKICSLNLPLVHHLRQLLPCNLTGLSKTRANRNNKVPRHTCSRSWRPSNLNSTALTPNALFDNSKLPVLLSQRHLVPWLWKFAYNKLPSVACIIEFAMRCYTCMIHAEKK